MKAICIIGLLALVGCAGTPSMDELEQEALRTGDWSKVEQREEVQARREAERRIECPEGYMAYCNEIGTAGGDCSCVSREVYQSMFQKANAVQPSNPLRSNN